MTAKDEKTMALERLIGSNLRVSLSKAKSERNKLQVELYSLRKELKHLRRRLKKVVIIGLGESHQAKQVLKRGKA